MSNKPKINRELLNILEQLREDFSLPESGDGRKHERRSWCVVMTVEVDRQSHNGTFRKSAQITTHDISRGGFSFIYHETIPENSKITGQLDMLPNKPVIHGVIRSCFHLIGNQYKIGVQFADVARKK